MVFGKIRYLNLLPFHVFLKRHFRLSQQKAALAFRKGVPAEINQQLDKRRIDAAVISSVKSFGYQCADMGIVAQNEVLSVYVVNGTQSKDDHESNTSNVLANILGLEGEVLIGDKALKRYVEGVDMTDMGLEWKKRYGLPFVFARLCFCRHGRYYRRMSELFLKRRVKIPYYILRRRTQETGIPEREILAYLTKISYRIGYREKRTLKIFRKEAKTRGLIP